MTKPDTILSVRGLVRYLSVRRLCCKVQYPTPAAAKKALREHGYTLGAREWYMCKRHGPVTTYHLTSMRQ